jgi:hypothetical protein
LAAIGAVVTGKRIFLRAFRGAAPNAALRHVESPLDSSAAVGETLPAVPHGKADGPRYAPKSLGAPNPHQQLLALARPPALAARPDLGAAQSLGSAVGEVFAGPRAAIARFVVLLFRVRKKLVEISQTGVPLN